MKKFIRIVSYIVAALAVIVILAAIGLVLFFPTEKARKYAIEEGKAKLGREITIETAEVSFWGGLGIKLGNVAVGNPNGFSYTELVAAEAVDVKLSLWSLIQGEFAVDRMVINKPVIRLEKKQSGEANYTFSKLEENLPAEVAEGTSAETKAAAAAVSFDNLEIIDGSLTYSDDSAGLSAEMFGITFVSNMQNEETGIFDSKGKLSCDSVVTSLTDKLRGIPFALDYQLLFDYPREQLTVEKSSITVGELTVDLTGELTNLFGAVSGSGSVRADDVSFADLLPLVNDSRQNALDDLSITGRVAIDSDIQFNRLKDPSLSYFGTMTLNDITLKYAEIPGTLEFSKALFDVKTDQLRFTLEDGYFDGKPLKGHMVVSDFSNPLINGAFDGALDIAYLRPFIKDTSITALSGLGEFAVKVYGHPREYKNLTVTGSAKVTSGQYQSSLLPEKFEDIHLDLYFDRDMTIINSLKARSQSLNLSCDGRVSDLFPFLMSDSAESIRSVPTFEGNVNSSLALGFLPTLLSDATINVAGDCSLAVNVRGNVERLSETKTNGVLYVSGLRYSSEDLSEPVTAGEIEVRISPDSLRLVRGDFEFESSDLRLTGVLKDPFPYLLPIDSIHRAKINKPHLTFAMRADKFNIDKLFPEAVPGADEAKKAPLIFTPDIDGLGQFIIDSLVYNNMQFTDAVGYMKIENRTVNCYNVKAKIYGGDVTGTTTIDLSDLPRPKYSGKFDAVKIEANELLSRFTTLGGHLFGKVSYSGTFTGAGWEPATFKKSLSMNSIVNGQSGKLVFSGPMLEDVTKVEKLFNKPIGKEHALRNISSVVKVKDGKLYFEQLKTILGDVGDLELTGYIGFDKSVDYTGKILLSEEFSGKLQAKTDIFSSLFGQQTISRISLPLIIGGTTDQPKLQVDTEMLKSALGDKVSDDIKKAFEGL